MSKVMFSNQRLKKLNALSVLLLALGLTATVQCRMQSNDVSHTQRGRRTDESLSLFEQFMTWWREYDKQMKTASPTSAPITPIITISPDVKCTCKSCTDAVWNTVANGYSCGERIMYLQSLQQPNLYSSEASACNRIGEYEYPTECGACDPIRCDGRQAPPKPDFYCGCPTCTEDVWQRKAGEVSCASRITWLMSNDPEVNGSGPDACRKVSNQFPIICGPACNPDFCSGASISTPDTPILVPPIPASPLEVPSIISTAAPNSAPIDDSNLYCFPEKNGRVQYKWGKHYVEVKESNGLCGPGDNRFSRNTVSMSGKDLTLQFKMDNGVWTGSEVRVLLPPNEMPISYGTFRFSVKSVSHKRNGIVIANDLPPSLIIGLFTWDPTDDYAIREEFSHEVDIEISRWNITDDYDAQFLVQPPGNPQMYRYSTGTPETGTRNPGGHKYEFTWNPGMVTWNTDAGGGHSHSYSTEQAIQSGTEDYVQCLPAQVEVRMNVWNMFGTQTPTDMTDLDVVDVVIDNFKFIKSGEVGLANGKQCTKDCQCMPSSVCSNNLCISR